MSLGSVRTHVRGRHAHLKALAAGAVEWALDLLVDAKHAYGTEVDAIRDEDLAKNIRVYFPDRIHGKVVEIQPGPFDVSVDGKPLLRFAMAAGHTRYDYAKLRDMARMKYDADDREYQSRFHVAVFVYNRDSRAAGNAVDFFRTIVHELKHALDFMEYVAATYNIESQYNVTDAAVDRLHRAEARVRNTARLEYRAERAAREALLPVTREEIERRIGPLWRALHPHAS